MTAYQLAPVSAGQAQWDSATVIKDLRPPATSRSKPLTGRQADVLACIRDHLARYGYPPTRRQIARDVGFKSVSSVQYQLEQLEAKGALTRGERSVRGLRLAEPAPTAGARHLYLIPGGKA